MPKVDFDSNGRTHAPDLAELTAELDGLRSLLLSRIDALKDVIDERDRLYKEREDSRRMAVDTSFAAQKEAINAALAAADRAVGKAELATEKRFESVNEFRGTLDNQQRTLIARSEVDVIVRGIEEKFQTMMKSVDRVSGIVDGMISERIGIKGGWGYAAGVVGLLLAIGSLLIMGIRFVKGG